jgi:hypothetical protein
VSPVSSAAESSCEHGGRVSMSIKGKVGWVPKSFYTKIPPCGVHPGSDSENTGSLKLRH